MKIFTIRKSLVFLAATMVLSTSACMPKRSLHISQASARQGNASSQAAEVGPHAARSVPTATAAVDCDALNLRAKPSMEAPILGILTKGTQVGIHNSRRQWAEVSTREGLTGWVSKRYLTGFEASPDELPRMEAETPKTTAQETTPTSDGNSEGQPTSPGPEPPKTADMPKPDRENHPPPNAPENIDGNKNHEAVETVSNPSTANSPGPNQDGVVFADPQGHFEVRYPAKWRESHGLQYDVEQFRLQSPSAKLEFWILNTLKTDGYTLPQFYSDMVAPLKQLYGEDIEIRPLKGNEAAGAGWLRGHVTLRSGDRASYDYVMTENAGRFWVIMEIHRPGAPRGEAEALGAIKNTFSFSAKN